MNAMRRVLVAATAALVVLCVPLTAAGGDFVTGSPGLADGGPLGWLRGWVERALEWFDDGEREGLRPVVEMDGCGMDPNGTPLLCPSGGLPVAPAPVDDGGCAGLSGESCSP